MSLPPAERVRRARAFSPAAAMAPTSTIALSAEFVSNGYDAVVVDMASSQLLQMTAPNVHYVCSVQPRVPLLVLASPEHSTAGGASDVESSIHCRVVHWVLVNATEDAIASSSPSKFLCPERAGVRWVACTPTAPMAVLDEGVAERITVPLSTKALAQSLCAGNQNVVSGQIVPFYFPPLVASLMKRIGGTAAAVTLRRDIARIAQRIGVPSDPPSQFSVVKPEALQMLHEFYPAVFPFPLTNDPLMLSERQDCIMECANASKGAWLMLQLLVLKHALKSFQS